MLRFLTTLATLLALAPGAPGDAAGCRSGHCAAQVRAQHSHRHIARARGYGGRVLSGAPTMGQQLRPHELQRPGFTERPVLPGQTPLPAYLPNNAPPVFAPQPLP